MRHLLYALALVCTLAASAHALTEGRPVGMLWDYTVPLGTGVVATSFIIQTCQAVPDCTATCTPVDTHTITPASIAQDLAYSDVDVIVAYSYRYQVIAVGTVNGVPTRSDPSNQACIYVPAKHRGSPTPIAP